MKSHHKDMNPLSFPLCEQPSQPSSPISELLSANPHIWPSWNPAVQSSSSPPFGRRTAKNPRPPDQLSGWMRMFTQRAGNAHVSSAPLCQTYTPEEAVYVCMAMAWMAWGFTGQGRPPQADCTSYPLGLPHLPDAVFSCIRRNLKASSSARETKGHKPPAVSECL